MPLGGEFDELPPWEAFVAWSHRLVGYMVTKQALAHELLEYLDRDAPLFQTCRAALFAAGQPVLERAQQAGAVRADTDLGRSSRWSGASQRSRAPTPSRSSTSSRSRSTVCATGPPTHSV